MALRGGQAGNFFTFRDGTPLTKTHFVARVRQALTAAWVNCNPFHIGAATAASLAGIQALLVATPTTSKSLMDM